MVHVAQLHLPIAPDAETALPEHAARRSTPRRVVPSGERVSPHLCLPRPVWRCIHLDTVYDPACGSGNFLTETYIWLRRLENKVLSELNHHQTELVLTEDSSPLKVSLDQFYGIEINDFAVNVALTALWIAELQANAEAQTIVTQQIEDLPLEDKARIVHGNALRTDWNEVLPAREATFIIGNPVTLLTGPDWRVLIGIVGQPPWHGVLPLSIQ